MKYKLIYNEYLRCYELLSWNWNDTDCKDNMAHVVKRWSDEEFNRLVELLTP